MESAAGTGTVGGEKTTETTETTVEEKEKTFTPIESQEDLDRIVKTRLARQKEQFADYGELKRKAEQFDQLSEAQKSELQKATDTAAAEKERADNAEARADRLEVALEKGLTAVQAKRLVGATKEELEADAEELVQSFTTSEDGKDGGPGRKPKEKLVKGGTDPTEDVTDVDAAFGKALVEGMNK